MGEAGGTLRLCPECGVDLTGFDAPRFCASCGHEVDEHMEANGEAAAAEPVAKREDVKEAKRRRVWPPWVALVFALSASTGLNQSIENGEQVEPSALVIADFLLLGSVAWLVWFYVSRWRQRRT